MRLGIIGLPQAGKTTVFNAVAGARATVGGFGQPGEIHRAIVKIPDHRLAILGEFMKSKKLVHAEIEYLDFPPPLKTDRGSENVFPPALRECEGIVAVLNCFDPLISRSPLERLKDLQGEMLLSDLIIADKRRVRLEKDQARGLKGNVAEYQAVKKVVDLLEAEKPLRTADFSEAEKLQLRGFAFLSFKPLLVVLNTAEGSEAVTAQVTEITIDPTIGADTPVTSLCGNIEMELADLDKSDREAFLADFGIDEAATTKLIRLSYERLDLITFFTGAEIDSHAWPIRRGTVAVNAAGEIHQDIKRGFIRAEVVPVETLVELGGMAACRKAAKARLEGKEYQVADGDYILFRFNV